MYLRNIGGNILFYCTPVPRLFGIYRLQGAYTSVLPDAYCGRQSGVFGAVCQALLKKFASVRTVGTVLVLLSFFMSMLLTNDVTLVTLVPFTLLLFKEISGDGKGRAEILLLVLETAAAHADGQPSESVSLFKVRTFPYGIYRRHIPLFRTVSDYAAVFVFCVFA